MLALFYAIKEGGSTMTEIYDTAMIPDTFESEADCAAAQDEICVKDSDGNTVRLEVPDDVEDDQA